MTHSTNYFLVMLGLVFVMVALDLVRTLKSGRAGTWMNGTATRAHQPGRFRRYVYQGLAMLGLCVIAFVWVILSPDAFR